MIAHALIFSFSMNLPDAVVPVYRTPFETMTAQYSLHARAGWNPAFHLNTSATFSSDATPLYLCQSRERGGSKQFISLDHRCKGMKVISLLGYASQKWVDGKYATELNYCYFSADPNQPSKAEEDGSFETCLNDSKCSILVTTDVGECEAKGVISGSFLGHRTTLNSNGPRPFRTILAHFES